jgi:hypothetical protein
VLLNLSYDRFVVSRRLVRSQNKGRRLLTRADLDAACGTGMIVPVSLRLLLPLPKPRPPQ